MTLLDQQYAWLQNNGGVDALAELAGTDIHHVETLLVRLPMPAQHLPFKQGTPAQWMGEILKALRNGAVERGFERLLNEACDVWRGNAKLKELRSGLPGALPAVEPTATPGGALHRGHNITLVLPDDITEEELLHLVAAAKIQARRLNKDVHVDLVTRGSKRVQLHFPGMTDAGLAQTRDVLAQVLQERGIVGEVEEEPYGHRDYYMDLLIVGPDGRRFEATEVRGSTVVKDVARMVMEEYRDTSWPHGKDGELRQAVVDLEVEGGTRRLDPAATLDEAGVQPNATLRVSPETTAGVDHVLRDEALVRGRVQVEQFLATHPNVDVESNSEVAPTEYLVRFRARSFGPPESPGGAPRPIVHHELLVVLPREFPIEAPQVIWQTPIFHPNIDPQRGGVCLGELTDRYRPGLHFGDLLQQLVDMAAWRNYTANEGYDAAAMRWAHTPDGQTAIQELTGGASRATRAPRRLNPLRPL